MSVAADTTVQTPEICSMSAQKLTAMIRRRELSSREVVAAFLGQIDALNPRFNALVSMVDRDQVLAQADAADAKVAAHEALGALHGLPLAIKDMAIVNGVRTTFGSPIYESYVPTFDATVVERMRAAGVVILGKTNVPEFGLGSHTFNPIFGPTRNAWNSALSAGGSSGGAAVALALRMLPVADGGDMGGSLRNPAAFNNVIGLRPSQGRVPAWPRQDAFYNQLTTEGPMGRSAGDVALLLSVQAGYDPRAPLSLEGQALNLEHQLEHDFRGARVGWLGDLGGHLAMEDGICSLCQTALTEFEAAGMIVESIQPQVDWPSIWNAFTTLRSFNLGAGFSADYDKPRVRALMKPELQWEIERCRSLSVADVQRAMSQRTVWYDALLSLFKRFDFIALPSAQVFPFPIEERWPASIDGRAMDSYHRWMEVVAPATLSGCPVINLPAGFNAAGSPMGVQIIGRPRDDLSLLRLARLYETLTSWLDQKPPAITSQL